MKIEITFKNVEEESRISMINITNYKGLAFTFDEKYCKKLDKILEDNLRKINKKGNYHIESIKINH